MYHRSIYYILLPAFFLMPLFSCAQKLFSEGIITYQVSIDPPDNAEGITQYSGTYTITLKGKNIKKELKLDNGFLVVMLHTSDNNIYSLKKSGDKKIAIQLDKDHMEKQYGRYNNFQITKTSSEKQPVAGYMGYPALITYKEGTTSEIIYTEEWKTETNVFERLPGITVLPLNFKVQTDDGVILHFRVKHIDATLVESSNFKIPTDYKIMSNAEYRELKQ